MHKKKLSGVFAPITTPFTKDGMPDTAGLEFNMKKYAASPLRGYLAIGSNGENKNMTEAEKLKALEIIVNGKGEGTVCDGRLYCRVDL